MPALLPLSLAHRRPGRIRPELGPLRNALEDLGKPQYSYPSILIVGTNGKGSTAAMLSAVLEAHGVLTGLTTSPHLMSVEERIRIGGDDVAPADLERQLSRLETHDDLTFFETLTAAAFLAFAEAGVRVAVLEAGMGGSWDATRVADSAIAGITNVGSDHAAWLGADAVDRARDKGVPLADARWAVLGSGMASELVPALSAPHAVPAAELVEVVSGGDGLLTLAWPGHRFEVEPPLAGTHQIANLQLALALARCAAAAGWVPELEPDAVRRGLAAVRWPGRLCECEIGGRTILVDGAHNLEGAQALAHHLSREGRRRDLLFSCLDDKPVEAMARILGPMVRTTAVIELDDDRAMPLDRLATAFPGSRRCTNIDEALEMLEDPAVAAGSLRLVGLILALAEEGGNREE